MLPLHNLFNLPKRRGVAHRDDMVMSYAYALELFKQAYELPRHLMSQERTPMRHTSPSTLNRLALGDTVELGGKTYTVQKCCCRTLFALRDSEDTTVFRTGHQSLESIADILRKQFAALPKVITRELPKEVPALAVGQKWRTRDGQIVTIEKSRHGDSLCTAELPWWYESHRLSKACHSPGTKSEGDKDTLVELVDTVAPPKSYTIVLTEDEARLLRDLNQRTSGNPRKSRRGLLKSIDEKLASINVPVDYDPAARIDLPNNIEIADRKVERKILMQPQVGQLIRGLRASGGADVVKANTGAELTVQTETWGEMKQSLLGGPEDRAVEVCWPWEQEWTTVVNAS